MLHLLYICCDVVNIFCCVLIQIMNLTMNSTIAISNTRGNDSGNYTCQLTLTVVNMDNFTFSETAIIALRGE